MPEMKPGKFGPFDTLRHLIDHMRERGITVESSPDGGYRVNFVDGTEDTAYYTNDPMDAYQTGVDMAFDRDRKKDSRS